MYFILFIIKISMRIISLCNCNLKSDLIHQTLPIYWHIWSVYQSLLTAQLMPMPLFCKWGESSPLYVSLTLPPPLHAQIGLISVQTCFGVMPQMVMRLCNPCRFPRFINSKTSSRSLRSEQTLLNQGVFIMPVRGGGCNYCKQEQTCKEKWISQI